MLPLSSEGTTMKRFKKIQAAVSDDDMLYDLNKIAGEIEAFKDKLTDMEFDYQHEYSMETILDDVISAMEQARLAIMKGVRRNFDEDEYSKFEYFVN